MYPTLPNIQGDPKCCLHSSGFLAFGTWLQGFCSHSATGALMSLGADVGSDKVCSSSTPKVVGSGWESSSNSETEPCTQCRNWKFCHKVGHGGASEQSRGDLNLHFLEWPARSSSTGCKKDFYISLWENNLSSQLIYCLGKHFFNDFMVSFPSFRYCTVQHDVHFVNDGPILRKINNKERYALGSG